MVCLNGEEAIKGYNRVLGGSRREKMEGNSKGVKDA